MLRDEQAGQLAAPTLKRPLTILVLCTGNSARSIMAEALFNHLGKPLIRAISAGSHPVGQINPFALEQIQTHLHDDGSTYRSKSWDQYAGSVSSEPIDILLTVCGNAARGQCPVFPGDTLQVHWEFSDPAATPGNSDEVRATFSAVFLEMQRRIVSLMKLPLDQFSKRQVADALRALSLRGEK